MLEAIKPSKKTIFLYLLLTELLISISDQRTNIQLFYHSLRRQAEYDRNQFRDIGSLQKMPVIFTLLYSCLCKCSSGIDQRNSNTQFLCLIS